jgi:hypothetical protein
VKKHPEYDDRAGDLFKGLYDQIVLCRHYCAADGVPPDQAERMAVEQLIDMLVMIASSTSIAPDELLRMLRREIKANVTMEAA